MRRFLNLLGFLACVFLLGYAYYLQYVMGLQPCPLCILQRIFIGLLGLVFLLATLHRASRLGSWIYGLLLVVFGFLGAAVSLRQIWLQYFTTRMPTSCAAGLGWMFRHLPPIEALRLTLSGSGNCAQINWTFLGLSMPVWVLACFLFLASLGGWINFRAGGRKPGR
jgi:disulfide bond formation protein DsbB